MNQPGQGTTRLARAVGCSASRLLWGAVHCTACGQELPDDARFCSRCGAPQGAAPTEAGPPTHWESARIVWQKLGLVSERFEAEVTTPGGTYRICDPSRETFAADKRTGPRRNDALTVSSHRSLVERLIREGFEPVGVGDQWWMERFRRPAGQRDYETCEITLQRSRFVADALGPGGHYTPAQTEKLPGLTRRKKIASGQAQLSSLVEHLRQEGWEPVEGWGQEAWQKRFKRKLA